MMGDVNRMLARELAAGRISAADRARTKSMATASIVGPAAMQRQRARVRLSLLLVADRRESAAKEAR